MSVREFDPYDYPAVTDCIECCQTVMRDEESVACLGGCGERICKPCEEKSSLCGQCKAEAKQVFSCIDCGEPTAHRLCDRCFVVVKL